MDNALFERTPVPKAYLKLAAPVVLSMVVGLIYNMVDTYFVARTGNTSLVAGVSLCAPVFSLMIGFGDIFGLGGSSVLSRLFGQKNYEDGRRISAFCFYAGLLFGCLVLVILLAFRGPILRLLGAGTGTMAHAKQYYTYLAIGAPLIILAFTPMNQLRTEGLANASMAGDVAGVVVNIILDPIFILTLRMGAAGAAIATVIGYLVSDVYYLVVYLKRSRQLSIKPREARVRGGEFLQILAIGIPASVTNVMQSISTMLTNRSLLVYGTDKVAAMGIVSKVISIVSMVLIGFAFGGQPLFGYNYGAGNHKRLKETLKFAYLAECGMALVLSAVMELLAPSLIRIFMNKDSIVSAGTQMIRIQLLSMVFVGVVLITTCAFQSFGKAGGAFILSICRQGVLFIAALLIGSKLFGYIGVLSAQAVADVLTAMIAFGLLFRFANKGKRGTIKARTADVPPAENEKK